MAITLNYYLHRKQALKTRLASLRRREHIFNINCPRMDDQYLSEERTERIRARWNKTYDQDQEVQDNLYSLECAWNRRNWTGADYESNRLAQLNID